MYGFFTVLAYLSTIILRADSVSYPISYLDSAIGVSTLALLAFSIPFFFRPGYLTVIFQNALDKIAKVNNTSFSLSITGFIFLSLVFLAACISQVFLSSGGILWITDSREAYAFYRSGNGLYYIFYLYSLLFLFLYTLYMLRPQFWGLICITIIFIFLSLFSGKKAFALTFILISIFYYNFNIKKINLLSIIPLFSILILSVVLLIYIWSGEYDQGLWIVLDYFNYADLSAEFLYRHDEFGYFLGKAYLDSWIGFIPRSLYPEKPFEHGVSLVHQIIHPGLAETGHTTGYFMWLSSYLDFGIIGVIISYGVQGWVSRAVFEWYLSRRDTLFSFVLMLHFSFFEVWFFSPAPIAFFICLTFLIISAIFKKRFLV